MESCQVCGRPAQTEAFLEGARVWLCNNCLRFGRAVEVRRPAASRPAPAPTGGGEVGVVDGFGAAVRRGREAKRLSVAELARKIFVNEKELAKIEREELVPAEGVARKLERELGVKVLENR